MSLNITPYQRGDSRGYSDASRLVIGDGKTDYLRIHVEPWPAGHAVRMDNPDRLSWLAGYASGIQRFLAAKGRSSDVQN
jgi:hypothetical protein